jgi:hypothetical protein
MLRFYVIACSGLAALSLVPWTLIAVLAPDATLAPPRPEESMMGVWLAFAVVWLYPLFVGLFGMRSWRLYRAGDYGAAAGPTTLIGLPALLVLSIFLAGRGGM